MWYFTIYDWMVGELQLKGRELIVYAYLYSWGKECPLSYKTLGDMLHISERQMNTIIQRLNEAGLLRGKNCTKTMQKLHNGRCKNCTDEVQKLHDESAKIAHEGCENCTDTIHKHIQLPSITGSNAHAPERTHEYIITGIVDFYAERGQTYMPNWSTMTTAAEELDAKMVFLAKNKNVAPDGDSLATLWTDFLNAAYAHADEWQRNHFTLDTLNSQFQVFINQISNGRQHINGSGGVSDGYIADAIRTAFGGAGSGAD